MAGALAKAKTILSASEPWTWIAKMVPECATCDPVEFTRASNNKLLMAMVPAIQAKILELLECVDEVTTLGTGESQTVISNRDAIKGLMDVVEQIHGLSARGIGGSKPVVRS